jgi:endonuclease/exonuclease/phosphatase family metal-dependent hydrolase
MRRIPWPIPSGSMALALAARLVALGGTSSSSHDMTSRALMRPRSPGCSPSRLRPLATALIAALAVTGLVGASAAQAATPTVKVMTRNLYIGTDLSGVVQATTFPQFLAATARAFTTVEASDPPGRMSALAREIRDADPMIIGLQEVQLIERDTAAPTNDGPSTPANQVVFDFLQMLLDDLASQGTRYTVVTAATNVSSEVPTALGFDVKVTDRDVMLAKAGLPSDELSWASPSSANFAATLTLPTAAGPLAFKRGYNVADFKSGKRSFRLVNTHLEAFSSFHRSAQANELLSLPLRDQGATQVLVGDINSDPGQVGTNPYDLFATEGFADAWTQANPGVAGLTCCFREALLDPDTSAFDSRIDVALTRNVSAPARSARIYGTDPDNRTASGRWPSDHAGVTASVAP